MSSHRAGRRRRGTTTVLTRPSQIRKTTSPPSTPGETVLDFQLRDTGTVDDLWRLHLDSARVAEEEERNADLAATRKEEHAGELAALEAQAQELAQKIQAEKLAWENADRAQAHHEGNALKARNRATDHAETVQRLCTHNSIPHPAQRDASQSGQPSGANRLVDGAQLPSSFPAAAEQSVQPLGDTPLAAQAAATVGMAVATDGAPT